MQQNSAAEMGAPSQPQEGASAAITVEQLSAVLCAMQQPAEWGALQRGRSPERQGVHKMAAVARERLSATQQNLELVRLSLGNLEERLRRVAALADAAAMPAVQGNE